jgi:hypothetical protein
MFKHIEKMRQKSDAEKVRYILGVSLGITAIIAAFWTVALAVRINSGSVSFKVDAPKGEGLKDISGKIGDSWEKFFPKVDPVATSTPTGFAGATGEASSAPDVILDQPQVVDPYPADVY